MRKHFLFLCSLAFISACGSVDVTDLDANDFSGTGPCEDISTSFSTNIVPIFSAQGCSNGSCHSNASQAGSLNLDVSQGEGASGIHASILDGRIDEDDSANSAILRKPLGLDGHGGGEIFSSVSDQDYLSIFCWIEAGAEDDSV